MDSPSQLVGAPPIGPWCFVLFLMFFYVFVLEGGWGGAGIITSVVDAV